MSKKETSHVRRARLKTNPGAQARKAAADAEKARKNQLKKEYKEQNKK